MSSAKSMRYLSEVRPKGKRPYFLVRVPGCRQRTFSFDDGDSGQRSAALKQAAAYRDELFAPSPVPPRHRPHANSSVNSSGFIGLSRVSRFEKGRLNTYWVASFPRSTGKPHNCYFMVNQTRTEREAFCLAAEARYERCGPLVQVREATLAPCDPPVPIIKRLPRFS